MNKKSTLITGIILIFCAQSALAAYKGNVTVSTIRGIGQTDVYVRFDIQPPDTCNNYGEYLTFDSSTTNGKALLSGLMLAISANTVIDIWYAISTAPGTDQSNGCSGNAVAVLTQIRLRN